ncbi:MAG: ester cyclase [Ginsengibacter sp.]
MTSKSFALFTVSIGVIFCFFDFQCTAQVAQLTSNNKTVIKQFIEVVLNNYDLNRKGAFFQADYIWHTMDGKDVHNSEDSSHDNTLRWLFTAIPDVHYTVDNIEAGGDMVGVSTTATGTARGEMFGLAAGKKKVRYKQMFLYRLKDSRIAEQWEVVDVDKIKAQLN